MHHHLRRGGIGKEIALTFARAGGKIVIADLDRDAARATAAQIGASGASAMGMAMNVVDEAEVNAGVAEVVHAWGGVGKTAQPFDAGIAWNREPRSVSMWCKEETTLRAG